MATGPLAGVTLALLLAACSGPPATRHPLTQTPPPRATGLAAHARALAGGGSVGLASYYHTTGLTAAHRSLPFGTRVRVTNTSNGRSVVVRINDRGPFIRGRSIDLSDSAAEAVGMTQAGVTQVRMEVIR